MRPVELARQIAEMVGEPAQVGVTNRICSASMAATSQLLD